MNLYLTGGAVREHLFGRRSNDFDFAVESADYTTMRDTLLLRGLHIWQERPEFVTVRGILPRGALGGDFGGLVPRDRPVPADFTLCRAEAQYSDKRHPDTVTPTDLQTDLRRRDFTINAVAVSVHGVWFDAFGGRSDALNHTLRTVGKAHDRFTEDPLRMLRAVRFAVTCNLSWSWDLSAALSHSDVTDLISTLPHERVREELNKALRHDWRRTMLKLLVDAPRLGESLHPHFPNLWLRATTEER